MGASAHTYTSIEFAFLSNSRNISMHKSAHLFRKEKNAPNFTFIKLVWHNHYSANFCVCKEKRAEDQSRPQIQRFIMGKRPKNVKCPAGKLLQVGHLLMKSLLSQG